MQNKTQEANSPVYINIWEWTQFGYKIQFDIIMECQMLRKDIYGRLSNAPALNIHKQELPAPNILYVSIVYSLGHKYEHQISVFKHSTDTWYAQVFALNKRNDYKKCC